MTQFITALEHLLHDYPDGVPEDVGIEDLAGQYDLGLGAVMYALQTYRWLKEKGLT